MESLLEESNEEEFLIRPTYTQQQEMLETARNAFASGKTLPYAFRLKQLKNLSRMLKKGQEEICDAVYADLKKPRAEVLLTEIIPVHTELDYQIRNLKANMRKESALKNVGFWLAGMDAYIQREPFGVVAVISTWNFPCASALTPLVGALAAGNCVVLKQSELSFNSTTTIGNLLRQYLDNECYQSYETDAEGSKELLKNKFDYIFFTGSPNVGRSIMTAAAQHLTPVTLELGGKCPAYVDESCNIKMVAERILWGKCFNLGQTCLSPDYMLCSESVQTEFLKYAPLILNKWFGQDWRRSEALGRIINNEHFHRLRRLLTKERGCIVLGGKYDEKDKWISPTILTNVSPSAEIMNEEIFGPILPIVIAETPEQAIAEINSRPKSLAAYIFTKKRSIEKMFIEQTSSGGVCVNDIMFHFALPHLPFGGVGESGFGQFHWKYSFETFSHKKAVMRCSQGPIFHKIEHILRYPPYNNAFINQMMRFTRAEFCLYNFLNFGKISNSTSHFIVFVCGILVSYLLFYFLIRI